MRKSKEGKDAAIENIKSRINKSFLKSSIISDSGILNKKVLQFQKQYQMN